MDSDTSNSGIYVVEGPSRGQPIPVEGDSVTAFVGPAARGPVDHAVPVSNSDEFLKTFGKSGQHCRLEFAVRQFFINGGSNAVVVRVSGTSARNLLHLSAGEGELVLQARNPGSLEYLRASIDFDGIDAEATESFNLTVQRLRTPGSAWIDSQEYYRGISIDKASRDYVGYLLQQSEMVTLAGEPPAERPDETFKASTMRQAGYVETIIPDAPNPPPSDYDLIGSAAAGTGLNALQHVSDIAQIILLPGTDGAALGPVALVAADRFCREHQAMLIIDPPARWRTIADVQADQRRSDFSSPNAITWFPGVYARDENGRRIMTSAAGSVAAALIAQDRSNGVTQLHTDEPVMLRSGVRPMLELNPDEVHCLNRLGINVLMQRSALHLQLRGNVTEARYGTISADWNETQVRRQTLFILRRIRSGTRWSFFHECNADTWKVIKAQLGEFFTELQRKSILVGDTAQQSWFIKCDRDTNVELDGNPGELAFIVGFAVRRPDEFLAFRFHRSNGKCRIAELGWQSRLEMAS